MISHLKFTGWETRERPTFNVEEDRWSVDYKEILNELNTYFNEEKLDERNPTKNLLSMLYSFICVNVDYILCFENFSAAVIVDRLETQAFVNTMVKHLKTIVLRLLRFSVSSEAVYIAELKARIRNRPDLLNMMRDLYGFARTTDRDEGVSDDVDEMQNRIDTHLESLTSFDDLITQVILIVSHDFPERDSLKREVKITIDNVFKFGWFKDRMLSIVTGIKNIIRNEHRKKDLAYTMHNFLRNCDFVLDISKAILGFYTLLHQYKPIARVNEGQNAA